MSKIKYTVIGGGINGLAVARQLLLDHPTAEVTLLKKKIKLHSTKLAITQALYMRVYIMRRAV